MQVGHISLEHHKDKSPGLLAIVTGSGSAFLYACPGSLHFVVYAAVVIESLTKMLWTEELPIHPTQNSLAMAPYSMLVRSG